MPRPNSPKAAKTQGPARRAIGSSSAQERLRHAKAFLNSLAPATEVLVVSASRGAADDLVRAITLERGATVGLHRFSLGQLAARIAAEPLAARGTGPSSALGSEAVAARATFEATRAEALEYFTPVTAFPGFPRALASTLRDIRSAFLEGAAIAAAPRVGADLAALLESFDTQFANASAADRAEIFRVAAEELRNHRTVHPNQPTEPTGGTDRRNPPSEPLVGTNLRNLPAEPSVGTSRVPRRSPEGEDGSDPAGGTCRWSNLALLLLDVPCDSPAEQELIRALWSACEPAFATIPAGDEPALRTFDALTAVEALRGDSQKDDDLSFLRQHLFEQSQPAPREFAGDVTWFSAPGEARECAEIARFVLAEARRGVRFDEMAILLRSPQRYHGLLEHALARGGIPAWFDRGTRRPHAAGRAFLALLFCAIEQLSASRFAEYLSMGQVPPLAGTRRGGASSDRLSLPPDELLEAVAPGAYAGEEEEEEEGDHDEDAAAARDEAEVDEDSAIVSGTLRAPWKWERLLVESAVIGGGERWHRRLAGLEQEFRFNASEIRSKDPEDPRLDRIERDLGNLRRLREFSLPLIELLESWPVTATWGDWLDRLAELAPRVLRQPDEVLRVLADLRPMGQIGPVALDEVTRVVQPRLLAIEAPAPKNRYGRVFVGSPHQARGRTFRVVFVPGLAERMFPQRLAEDPLLIDEIRTTLGDALPIEKDRAATERLLLRLAVGAAADHLYVSYPRIDSAEARERVPSFYALEIVRAVTGKLPGPDELRRIAAAAIDATLAWPAPKDAASALDDFEHDLAVLAPLLKATDVSAVRGQARYLIHLSETLRRSVTSRWQRWERKWSSSDGIVRAVGSVSAALASQRLTARPYSLSALQLFAECPYRFLLSAVHRLEPFEAPQPLQRLDPLTKGSLVHRIQAEFFRALQNDGALPLNADRLARALSTLDAVVQRAAGEYADLLAPAIPRVWNDEIEAIGSDLREWATRLASDDQGWEQEYFEYAFGLAGAGHGPDTRDPRSRPDPVKVDGRFLLRGSVDLIERKNGTRERRVTDHKTGKNRSSPGMVVGGGRVLQPVLYGLAVEEALGDPVLAGRLSYCTAAGDFATFEIPLTNDHRRAAIEVLEIIDRAIETGFLVAAPNEGACNWCDFHVVCGPHEESRVAKKPQGRLGDLLYLRERP